MKKQFLFGLIMLFFCSWTNAQTINVSTGIDNSGNALPQYTTDPNWVMSNLTPSNAIVSSIGPWEITPVSSTNAQFLNNTGDQCCSNATGIHTFERAFNVPAYASNFTYTLSFACDDDFISAELVRPDLTTIPIPYISNPSSGYYLGSNVTNSISTIGATGVWKIRVMANFIDGYAGFLCSGNIQIPASTCNVLFDGFDDSLWIHPMTAQTCSTAYNEINVSGSKFNFVNAQDGHVNYMYKTGYTINNTNFKADIDFTPTAFGSSDAVGHNILTLKAGTNAVLYDPNSSSCSTAGACSFPGMLCAPVNEEAISVNFGTYYPYADPSSHFGFDIVLNDGLGGITYLTGIDMGFNAAAILGNTYYVRLERTSATAAVLSVFTDAARTIPITGSPFYFTIPATLDNFNTVALGNREGGYFVRNLTGTLDNLCISSVASPCTLTVTTTGSGCGTAACPYVCTGSPAGGTFSGPAGLHPTTGVYIGSIPPAGLPYTYTYVVGTCTYTVSGTITKPTSSPLFAAPTPVVSFPGPNTCAGTQLVVTWPCTGYTCGEWYQFDVQNSAGTSLCSPMPTSIAPSNVFPFCNPMPAGTCGKILNCGSLTAGSTYYVRMRVNRCGVFGAWSPLVSTPGIKPANQQDVLTVKQGSAMEVYPNPVSNGKIEVSFRSEEAGNYVLEIRDVFGKLLQQKSLSVNENESRKEELDIHPLASGIYMAVLRSGHGKQVVRFTVK